MAKDLFLLVDRKYRKSSYTIGKLYIDGEYFCDTLEDKDRGLRQTDPLAVIRRVKIPNETAIPAGKYQVTLKIQSAKYTQAKYSKQYSFCKGYLPRLINVPGFEGILIHIGNTNKDTSGCLLVGQNTQVGKVLNSTATFKKLYAILKKASDEGRRIWIEYR